MRRGSRIRIAGGEGISGRTVGEVEVIVAELRKVRRRLKHCLYLCVGISVALAFISGKQTVFVHIRRKQYAVIRHIPCKVDIVTQFRIFVLLVCHRILAGNRQRAAAEILAVKHIGEQVELPCVGAGDGILLPFGGKSDHLLASLCIVVKVACDNILIPPPSRA